MLDEAQRWFRSWFAKIWQVRGGGLYACGFALTFLYLEARTMIGEFIDADSIGSFFSEQLLEFVFRFAVDSLVNTMHAFIWPAHVVQIAPPFGAIGLGVAYLVFARFLKQPITEWLFPDGEPQSETKSEEAA